MKHLLLLSSLLLFPMFLFAQGGKDDLYTADWKKADSLLNNGFPESAQKIAQSIYDRATTKGQDVQAMKAQLYMMSADFQRSEEAWQTAITKAEGEAGKAAFPNNAIWQSIAAQLYWNYYQQNRWNIMQRTKVSGETSIEDFEQWDASRFAERTAVLYKASIQRAAELEAIPISRYDAILVKGENSRNLRPTLYDLLAFRALDFFQNDEKDITRPAFAFVMDDVAAFAPANEFTNHSFKTSDTASMQWQALNIYKRLLQLHKDDSKPDAFIDADLHRLEFAYNSSVHPDKKELYGKALEAIEKQWSNNELSALAAYRAAQLMMTTESTRTDRRESYVPNPESRKPANYVAVVARLQKIIAKYPKSEGGVLAQQSLQGILQPGMNLTAEEVVLPNEASRILISYRNVPKVWFRLYRVSNKDNRWLSNYGNDNEKTTAELLGMRPVKEWSVALPGTDDYDQHSTELMIDALDGGTYIMLASSKAGFDKENNILTYAPFQVSNISVVTQNNSGGYVLHRKNGSAISNVALTFYRQQYNNKNHSYDLVEAGKGKSDAAGAFDFNKAENNALRIISGSDTLFVNGYFRSYENITDNKPQTQTFFFTDRAIYRPGQTIFFKGIMLRKEDGGKKNNVIVGEESTVEFFDVNGQKIDSRKLKTNEFGSFTGSFTAPQGGLMGSMHINNSTGVTEFSVEEYKRPKFQVGMDTLKGSYALNETITVTGNAKAYAGNAIDGATVNYRVVRNTRFPYWWYAWRWGFPQSPQMEIANGTAKTDAEGKFKISFDAIPDKSINPESLPVFAYTITADVTDINGETHTGTQMVSVGYTALQLSINTPDKARPEDLDTISITSVNLSDQFVAADIKLTISKLLSPDRVLRKRLWQAPDQFLMDSVAFKKAFPMDAYRNEDDHLYWAVEKQVFSKSLRTTESGATTIPQNSWSENGWYVIEVTTTDKGGKAIIEKKYIQVLSADGKGKATSAVALLPQTQSLEPGSTAKVSLLSGYDNLHLLRQVQDMSTGLLPYGGRTEVGAIQQMDYKGTPITWSRDLKEEDRGGIAVTYLTVKENRVYTEQAFINVPWSNKDLNISWETHHDKLLPGTNETWTMIVRGNKKEKVAAEMVATLYDASLDAFRPHEWNVYGLFPSLSSYDNWNKGLGFGQVTGRQITYMTYHYIDDYQKRYDRLKVRYGISLEGPEIIDTEDPVTGQMVRRIIMRDYNPDRTKELSEFGSVDRAANGAALESAAPTALKMQSKDAANNSNEAILPPPPAPPAPKDISIRTNLQETAFFYPQLKTDADGNIRIDFTIPEALTEWKMMAFTHTKDMATGMLQGTVKTQKDLMVTPNLPRFLRQGDDIIISTKISNLSNAALNGMASIQILDVNDFAPIHTPFRLTEEEKSFTAAKGGSTTVSWKVHVPESRYEPVVIRIRATAGNFADGEEHIIPVITNRMLVTETLPLWINGNGSKDFSFDKLKGSASSNTLAQHALTLEYTGNPAWYAVQSLPYLMEYPYECAEQTFNRYYATALAAHIVAQSPKIKAIFERWKKDAQLSTLISPLEKNEELKSALLEETPWVLQAENESQQREQIARLFDTYRLFTELDASLRKLQDMQLPDGSFPWFKGMRADRYITQYIITGLGRLQALGVADAKNRASGIISKALPYLDNEAKKGYEELKKNKAKMDDQHIGYGEVQYLYMRSFMQQDMEVSAKPAYDYYKSQAAKYWAKFNPYLKGMIALSLHRAKDATTPKTIIASLRETAIQKEEMGMYWMQPGAGYWWYEAPIEAQSLLIEAFSEVAKDAATVDKMKIWLLKNKQTQSWETTKATADAVYALLLTGTEWLSNTPKVTVKLGNETVSSESQKSEEGSGYFKVRYDGQKVAPSMGAINVSVQDNPSATSWGAVYWQYFEDLDKITSAKTPLEIRKQLFIEKNTARGPELQAITANNQLKVGDKVKVRIEILVDRDMEYVHLKDMRAAAFEPVNVISGYSWQGGLGYYQSTRDVSTNFFFDQLRKGKYVFEYPVFVSQSGDFSNGIATIQCMYAPEFSSHSEGVRVQVK